MSLSEKPQVKITANTAKEICNDIWAGTIEYARETGYKLNPLVTTAIWNGLLLSVKKDLEGYGLFDAVQQQFVHSFSVIYDIGLDKVELLAEIKNKQHIHWEALSNGMGELHDKLEVLVFVGFLDKLNAEFIKKDEPTKTIKPLEECVRLFQIQSQLLSSHIYRLVHGLDNGMIRQFAASPMPSNSNRAVSQHPNAQPSQPKKSVRSERSLLGLAFLLIILAVLIFIAVFSEGDTNNPSAAPSVTQAQQVQKNQLQEKPKPRNGEILKGNGFGESELKITASTSEDHVVSLKTVDGTLRLTFYVRAGQTATVNVPAERLYVYFASGEKWYGYGKGLMFGEDTSYSRDDEVLDFTEYTWEYTLYPVSNGNFSETPSSENEFF